MGAYVEGEPLRVRVLAEVTGLRLVTSAKNVVLLTSNLDDLCTNPSMHSMVK